MHIHHTLSTTLCAAAAGLVLAGCHLLYSQPPATQEQAAAVVQEAPAPAPPKPAPPKVAPGAKEALAPPEGLPDLRGLLALETDRWMPSFMPQVTRSTPMKDVLDKLKGLKEVEENIDGEFARYTFVPDTPNLYPGVRKVELTFTKDEGSEVFKAYSVDIQFLRSVCHEPALHQYLHLFLSYKYRAPDEPPTEQNLIFQTGGRGTVMLSRMGATGTTLDFTVPDDVPSPKTSNAPKRPQYAPVRTIDPADFEPPARTIDARPIIGLDPDHWAPAFLPLMLEGTPEDEACQIIKEAGFVMKGKPDPNDELEFINFVPKAARKTLPGISKLRITVSRPEESAPGSVRGLSGIKITLNRKVSRAKDYPAYIHKLAELNFADDKPQPFAERLIYTRDDYTQFTAYFGKEIELEFGAPGP